MTKQTTPRLLGLLAATALALMPACGPGALTAHHNGQLGHGGASFTPGRNVHMMQMYDPEALTNTATSTSLLYYGGPVISNVKVVAVFWGASVNSTVKTQMPAFYAAFTKSPMYDWLNEYDTNIKAQNGSQGTNQVIGHGSFEKSVTITPSVTGTSVTDAQIQSELNAQITSGNLPAPDSNTIYMVHFPKGITITQGGSKSCSYFCAYHGTFTRSGKDVYYGVMPSLEAGTGCDLGCGGAATMIDNQTSVASHELIEATTDAAVGLATTYGPPLAWMDPSSGTGEIGDICNAQQGTFTDSSGHTWTVQKEWSNQSQACITQKSATSSDFGISLSRLSSSVAAGASTTVTVATTAVGSAESVTLSVSGLPAGVTGSFSPATVTAGQSSTLTLTAASSAAAVSGAGYTVTGTASSGSHGASGTISVTTGSGGTGDFTMSLSTTTVSMAPGGSQTITVHTTASGTPATVTFHATGLPTGVSAAFSATSITAGQDTTVTISAASSAPAVTNDSFRIYGESTAHLHYRGAHVTVTSGGGGGGGGGGGTGDFTMTLSTTSVSLTQGSSATLTVHTTDSSGAGGTIDFHVTGLPTGVSASFSSTSITAGQDTIVTLTASSSAPAVTGDSFRVYGESGSYLHYRGAHVTVTTGSGGGGGGGGTSPGDFSMTVSSTSLTIARGSSATFTVSTATVSGGGTPTVAFHIPTLPAGVTASFSPTSVTAGGSATVTLTVSSSAATTSGTAFRVYGQSSDHTHYRGSHITVQ